MHAPTLKKGFTLIELMVVIAIIGLLASIIMVSLASAQKKARDARRIADIKTIQLALETYYNDNNSYPSTQTILYGSALANYLPTVPCDPNSPPSGCTTQYQYIYTAWNSGHTSNCSGSLPIGYHLGAALEDNTNTALNQDADLDTQLAVCGTGNPDFAGKSLSCGSTIATPDGCYDVTN